MKSIASLLVLTLILNPFTVPDLFGARKNAPRKKSVSAPKKKDIVLSDNTIYWVAKDVVGSGVYTRIHQIDLLTGLFYRYQTDPRLLDQGLKIIITGPMFSQGYNKAKTLFGDEEKQKIFESAKKAPTIEYANFNVIRLFYLKRSHRLDLALKKAYTQEIPYTFGAKVTLQQTIRGTLRTNQAHSVAEIIFDSHKQVLFSPPDIAFFIPDIMVKIVSIRKIGNELIGYVIGYAKSSPKRMVAVSYNLSSCAKSSISTNNLTPAEFKKKAADVDYFGFAD
ncbi:MAG: hypothetical protein A2350_21405 [Candidatus Raymondbacteria bacterium RifOxyB12_full_50_8]|uniref:Uncharacterized protein n=1 Tax=Candidatus Raymondbacteria bacterium RIFOXYD12_FULL_49_13 TaxID=1817890 RepID=A0A1F7F9K0_UNCRA|nr:MAG: hypothetical protein A2248_09690 [Candidatus Raymondbacteria bacterium RIFOXYA2_FULL_49_16]OGJ91835.1 MAG: hypothetical protein A2350_21405 [Candidatus Raymondbacteria bacterium RifOxyB12_full_50_8]OGJ97175.1 MAG: hypothetical protein A2453_10335 [Candidatus Raymondbacteria bacterium RIFOXYC2_FULL_50_21]OGK03202.1 MAG: hypothetical protein A2519_05085 [Candidatus Raymondbacteria bacterium RIFOXYD12_FULL_49_13]OGP42906.1 MAG: hypothetical protein A2324_02845 [Candidatus Raymondbacteria b